MQKEKEPAPKQETVSNAKAVSQEKEQASTKMSSKENPPVHLSMSKENSTTQQASSKENTSVRPAASRERDILLVKDATSKESVPKDTKLSREWTQSVKHLL